MGKSKHSDKNTRAISDALREVFGVGEKAQKFVDVSRIPLLCKSVIEIRSDIGEIRKDRALVRADLNTLSQEMSNLRVTVQSAIDHNVIEDGQKQKDEAWRDKWVDRLWVIGLNAVLVIIGLILIRTNIINLSTK